MLFGDLLYYVHNIKFSALQANRQQYQYIKKTFQKVACNNKKLSIFQSIEELKENNNHNIRPRLAVSGGKKIVNVKRLHNEWCTRVKKIIICFPTSSKSAQKNVRSTLKIFESCYRCYYAFAQCQIFDISWDDVTVMV